MTDALAKLDIHDDPDMSIAEILAISDQHNESLRLQELCKHAEQDEINKSLQTFMKPTKAQYEPSNVQD